MSSAPIVDRIRIIPRPEDFLDRNVGASGEVFFNRATNSLRVCGGGGGASQFSFIGDGGSGIVIIRYRTS